MISLSSEPRQRMATTVFPAKINTSHSKLPGFTPDVVQFSATTTKTDPFAAIHEQARTLKDTLKEQLAKAEEELNQLGASEKPKRHQKYKSQRQLNRARNQSDIAASELRIKRLRPDVNSLEYQRQVCTDLIGELEYMLRCVKRLLIETDLDAAIAAWEQIEAKSSRLLSKT